MGKLLIIALVLLAATLTPVFAEAQKDARLVPEPAASASPQQEPFSPPASASSAPAASPAPAAGFKVEASTDRPDGTVAIGESLKVNFKSSADGFAYVIAVGTSGQSDLLFPNKKEQDHRVTAGQERTIPDASAGYRVKVDGPTGTETIIVLVATKSIDVYKHLGQIAPRRKADTLTLTEAPGTPGSKDLKLEEDAAGPDAAVKLNPFLAELEKDEKIDRTKDLTFVLVSLKVTEAAQPAAGH